jgi:predicted transglutaminase-like cysteine proteinase
LPIVLSGLFTNPIHADVDFNTLARRASERYGVATHNTILELQATLAALNSAPEKEKLRRINDFFNSRIRYFTTDMDVWGKSDYWATPLEALGRKSGDCEDYSIAKYSFLKQLGIADERLKLTYVRAQIGGPHSRIFQAHMVLSYYATPSAEPLILDNLIGEIRPASRRPDLTPIFSFNSEGLWVGTSEASSGNATAHLSRWRDVLARMRADGIE